MTPGSLRAILHAGTALLLLLLLGSWDLLRDTLLALGLLAVTFEVLRLRVPWVRERVARFVPVFRPQEGGRPSGAVWLFVAYALAARLPPPAPAAAVLVGALADPAAAVLGRRFGGGRAKSWPGTSACLLVAGLALWLMGLGLLPVVAGAVVATVLERWPGPFDDNLLIAPGVGLIVWWLG